MPRFRFTVRRMMVAVAIVSILIGAEAMRRRREVLASKASSSRLRQGVNQRMVEEWDRLMPKVIRIVRESERLASSRPGDDEAKRSLSKTERKYQSVTREVKTYERNARHWQMVAEKYERAARYPWLPVAPDPPEPK